MSDTYLVPELTNTGKAMIVQAMNGGSITFTRFVFGDGVPSASDDMADYTGLVNPRLSVPLTGAITPVDGAILLTATTSSTDIEASFYGTELGIYAKDADNVEGLFAYRYNSTADYFASSTDGRISEIEIQVAVSVGNAEDVSAIVMGDSSFVLKTDFDAHLANNQNPHGVNKEQVGLGNVPNVSTDNQTPSVETASALALPVTGETFKVILGKLVKGLSDFMSHLTASNPHGITPSIIGAAPSSHNHSATDITSGVLSVARGGTGASSIDAALSAFSLAPVKVLLSSISGQFGYYKFNNGLLIQWGSFNQTINANSYGLHKVTFSLPYTSTPIVIATPRMTSEGEMHVMVYQTSNTKAYPEAINAKQGFTTGIYNEQNKDKVYCYWIAIGKWK